MTNTNSSSTSNQVVSLRSLGLAALLFPICLVLYEFTVYIGNDMTQPAMPEIVKQFGADKKWIPTSMTAYLAGGMFLQWILGPLADRKGRRPVMLTGILFFIVTSLAILWVNNIEQFMVMRFLQGFGLCFIGAVGYAAIQESYDEFTAIKLTALMANVSLIAPMLGPLAGAALIKVTDWHMMFVIFAVLSTIAFVGIYKSMPESAPLKGEKLEIKPILADYREVLTNKQFIRGSIAVSFAGLPLLAWIAQTPVIFISDRGLDTLQYSFYQIPVFVALLIGNVTLAKITGKMSVTKPIMIGAIPLILGVLIAGLGTIFQPDNYWWMISGISLYAFGLGVANAGLFRLTLFASEVSKGTVSAVLGIFTVVIFTAGIEIAKYSYEFFNLVGFNLISLLSGLIWLAFTYVFLSVKAKQDEVIKNESTPIIPK